MKKPIILLLSLLLAICTYSQTVQYEDVVYLKNGSVIRGMIIEQIPNQTLKIKTADRNIFVFEFAEIEKITKEEIPQEVLQQDLEPEAPEEEYIVKEHGFESSIDMFLGMELGWTRPVLGMHVTAGYRIIPQLFLGAGTGMELYTNGNMLPVFFNVRTDFVKARVTPFFSVNIGYAFGWVNNAEGGDWGGLFLEPGIGFRFNISKSFGLNLSSSYKFQKAYHNDYYDWQHYSGVRTPITYRLFTFKVGFSF